MSAERREQSVVPLRPVGRCHPLERTKFIALREDYLSLLETPLRALLLEAINGACSARMYHLPPAEQGEQMALMQHDPETCSLWVELSATELRQRTGIGGKRQTQVALGELEERGFILRRKSPNAWSRSLEHLIQPHAIDAALLSPKPSGEPESRMDPESSDRSHGEAHSESSRPPLGAVEGSSGNFREIRGDSSIGRPGSLEDAEGKRHVSDEEIEKDLQSGGEAPPPRNPRLIKLGVPANLTGRSVGELGERGRELVEDVIEGRRQGVHISGVGALELAAVLLGELVERRKARGRPVWFQLPAVGLVIEGKLDDPERVELVSHLRGSGPLILAGLEQARGRQQLTLLEAAISTRVAESSLVVVAEERPGGVRALPEQIESMITSYCDPFELSAEEQRWSA